MGKILNYKLNNNIFKNSSKIVILDNFTIATYLEISNNINNFPLKLTINNNAETVVNESMKAFQSTFYRYYLTKEELVIWDFSHKKFAKIKGDHSINTNLYIKWSEIGYLKDQKDKLAI